MADPKIVTVPLPNTPGTLSAVAKILANEKINLDAIECTTVGEFGLVRIASQEPQRVERALTAKGYPVATTEYVEAEIENAPGSLHKVLDALAKSGVNVEGLWASRSDTENSRIVLRVDDTAEARRTLAPYLAQTIVR